MIPTVMLRATLRIGIALYSKYGKQLLIKKADAVMNYVKHEGLNKFNE